MVGFDRLEDFFAPVRVYAGVLLVETLNPKPS